MAESRDRGCITRYLYDAQRRLASTRDPLGRTITQQWCGCGSLEALIDGKGQKTSWQRDVQGRVTREVRADGTTETVYTYEGTTGRLKTITDPKLQVTTYSYNLDDTWQSMTFTNAVFATPSVSLTYDPAYNRQATMVDGTGTTIYTYHPVGVLGAGRLAGVDGPLTNDAITYAYDELGRVTTRALNGVGMTYTYDALGRVSTEVNVLGTFTYGHHGTTSRLASVLYPNGQTSTYSYFGNATDHRLQTIHHKRPDMSTLSRHDYTYDTVGNILTLQQQVDSASPQLWRYTYDAADQLTNAIKWSTGGSPTVLGRYAYTYDPAGNRTTEQIGDAATLSAHDVLNRLMQQQPGGALRFAETVSEPATVTIQGKPAVLDATNVFSGTAATATGSNVITIQAVDPSGNVSTAQYEVTLSGTGRTFSYDANGNLTSDVTRTFEWDAGNRLVAVTLGTHRSEFTYDGLNRRVRIVEKETGATVRDTRLYWDGADMLEERLSTGDINRFYSGGEQSNGTATYTTRDHHASVREVTDSAGTLVTRNDFDPYGRLTRIGGIEDSRHGFTGYYVHAASELALPLYRAYEAGLGRWLSEDPLGFADGPNVYAYVKGNPISKVDPTGLFTSATHNQITRDAMFMGGGIKCPRLPMDVADADWVEGSQAAANSHWHGMRNGTDPNDTVDTARAKWSGSSTSR